MKGFDGDPYTEKELSEILKNVTILAENSPIISQLIAKVVDKETKSSELRDAVKDLGMFMAYEISKTFPTEKKIFVTPMNEKARYKIISKDSTPVLFDILGASIRPTIGFEKIFKDSPHAVVSARRRGKSLEELYVEIKYERIPRINGRPIIFIDPAIATGFTIIGIYRILKNNPKKYGKLGRVIVCGFVAAPFGIKNIKEEIPGVEIYVASVSKLLNKKCYIHGDGYKGIGGGGIGDAGDRFLNVVPVD